MPLVIHFYFAFSLENMAWYLKNLCLLLATVSEVFVSQLAYSIATIVFMSEGLHSFALGLFVCGCAPGGGASNYWTLLLDGDLPVSITMTFLSTTAALGALFKLVSNCCLKCSDFEVDNSVDYFSEAEHV